jgi:hypothetical protein
MMNFVEYTWVLVCLFSVWNALKDILQKYYYFIYFVLFYLFIYFIYDLYCNNKALKETKHSY